MCSAVHIKLYREKKSKLKFITAVALEQGDGGRTIKGEG